MIKYNSNTINDWYYNSSDIIKVYHNGAVCYYKIAENGSYKVCFAVVDDITQYHETEFEDVFDKATEKWYKLNNLNQYEKYGVYASGRTSCESSSSRLPQGYTEVEYVQNTASGSNTSSTSRLAVKFEDSITNNESAYTYEITVELNLNGLSNYFDIFGNSYILIQRLDGGYGLSLTARAFGKQMAARTFVPANNTKYKFKIYQGASDANPQLEVTDITASTTSNYSMSDALSCSNNSTKLGLFHFYNINDSGARMTPAKIYEVIVSDREGNELCHSIPCVRDVDGKVGFYNLARNEFDYDVSGELSLSGGEPVTPTDCVTTYEGKLTIDDGYEYIYSGNSWVNVGEVSGSSITVYSPEYLERDASHNGYVGLGEYFQENTKIEIDFQMTHADGYCTIGDYFQSVNDDWRIFINHYNITNNYITYDFINSRNYYVLNSWADRLHLEIGNYYIKDLDSGNYLINATKKTNFTRPNQMYIFNVETTSTQPNTDYGHIYSLKIWQGDTLVKDFIPWTDLNGNYGLYDKVSLSAYTSTNQMTGSSTVNTVTVSGGTVYPLYYDEKSDPLDNLTFSTLTEAQTYAYNNCVYDGMKATIDGKNYVFDSEDGWVEKMHSLPNVPFMLNYNAKEYDASTKTLPKTEGQLRDSDAVCNYGYHIVDHSADGYITVTGNTRMVISGTPYFNRTNTLTGCTMTIVSKVKTTNVNESYSILTNRGDYGTMNWMWRYPSNGIFLHGSTTYNSPKYFTSTTEQPITASIRISYDGSVKQLLNDWTNNGSYNGAFQYGPAYSGNNAMFCDYTSINTEFWKGDFYWVYMSQEVLTDEQIQQVIDYNENL